MIGPDGVQTPAQSQDLNLGDNKTAESIVGADYALSVDGSTVTVTGTVKPVTEPWEAFDKAGNNTGHFAPIQLPKVYEGQTMTLEGLRNGGRTVTVDSDRLLILRLENLSGTMLKAYQDDVFQFQADFSRVIPVGEDAIDPAKVDFGGFGKMEDYVKDISIRWDGVTGYVSGTIKHHQTVGTKKVKAGWHYPLGLCAYYGDGMDKTVTVGESKSKTGKDKDWICDLSTARHIKVEYNGYTVLKLDFTGATFEEAA